MSKPLGTHNYFVYVTTNSGRTVLYTGMTNNLTKRMSEHKIDPKGEKRTFAGKYNCHHLIYWERFQFVKDAYAREKEIKGWKRERKLNLINHFNPSLEFLNDQVD